MGNRTKAREQVLQILYLIDLSGAPADEAIRLFTANFENREDEADFVRNLVQGVVSNLPAIDKLIESCSENWRLSRMPRIDRNILRIGAFELAHSPDVPPSVAMDEAIELGKKYGEGKTGPFVNGILDRISREARKGL